MTVSKTNNGVCIRGFKAAGVREGKTGVAIIASETVCESAGVFTTNSVKAAPVILTKKKVKKGINAVVVNSGNANACVAEGVKDAEEMCTHTAETLGIKPENIGIASTGIIGRRLNTAEIKKLITKTAKQLGCSPEKSLDAAKAIMTTDSKAKTVSAKYKGIEVGAIAKGAGMIAPNMATMLCMITTNANLTQTKLQGALTESIKESFNMIVVDGDESTNDTVLLMSNKTKDCSVSDFRKVLDYVTKAVAKKIAYDGEGATKGIELSVVNAKDEKQARKAVKAILSSPLVKTAVYGENPNWGRILSKLGSVVKVDYRKVSVLFSDGRTREYALKAGGKRGNLAKLERILKSGEIKIVVDLKSGKAKAVGWGCDLTLGYVKVNAEYN
ncbi:MAG: bifunctional ornithine acetyltransferase/N-acetylglutamate synthase [Candidatus Altiarchaeota archaeon]